MMRFFRNNLFPIVATAVVVVGTIFAVGRNRVAVEDGAAAAEPNSNNTDDKKTKKNGDEGTKKDGAPKETRKTKHDVSLDQAPVLVAYGSQTGNAKAIAQEVYEKLGRREIQANLSELNDWKKVRSERYHFAINIHTLKLCLSRLLSSLTPTCLTHYYISKWKSSLQNTKYALFVISTTGNGDAPDNCARFYRYLKKNDHPKKMLEG
jgi:sulfite reductase alpha subunit-like flavoprotein